MTLNLLFLDLETTGLNPDKCQIIECAAVLVRGEAPADEYGPLTSVVVDNLVETVGGEAALHWEQPALEMHIRSRLLDIWRTTGKASPAQVEHDLLAAIEPHGPRGVRLAGNSIHFDRSFLRVHMPRLDAALHHRHVDVSCLMTFFEEHAGISRTPANDHRAMADVRSSMAAYERLVKWTRSRATPDAPNGGA